MLELKNIEAERSRNGLSRTELANCLGVSMATYKRYVSGGGPIPSDKLIEMAHLFRCSTDYLLGLDQQDLN